MALAAVDPDRLEAKAGGRLDPDAVVTRVALDQDALEVASRQLELRKPVAVEVDAEQVRLGRRHRKPDAVGVGPAADHELLALDLDGGGRQGGDRTERGGGCESKEEGLREEAHGSVDG